MAVAMETAVEEVEALVAVAMETAVEEVEAVAEMAVLLLAAGRSQRNGRIRAGTVLGPFASIVAIAIAAVRACFEACEA